MTRERVRPCIYCGRPISKVKKGEHIFPNALGGVRTIKEVCSDCNNGKLSELDEHLVACSPVALVASEALGRGVGRTWDVDEASDRLLMEARPDWHSKSMTLWPQAILSRTGLVLRADFKELVDFGLESFPRLFFRKLKESYDLWNRGFNVKKKGLIFECLDDCNELHSPFSYPPRVFVRKSLPEMAATSGITFTVGYASLSHKRRIISALGSLDLHQPFRVIRQLGSELPSLSRTWDHLKVLRALTKIGINILYDCCERTEVDYRHFPGAIGFVLGSKRPGKSLIDTSGFVSPKDLSDLHRQDGGHAAKLYYQTGIWTIEISFFGGRICAVVRIPGPSREEWQWCKVGTPLKSKERDVSSEWLVTTGKLFVPRRYHINWNDPDVIIPGLELVNTRGQLKSVRVTREALERTDGAG